MLGQSEASFESEVYALKVHRPPAPKYYNSCAFKTIGTGCGVCNQKHLRGNNCTLCTNITVRVLKGSELKSQVYIVKAQDD